MTRISTVLSKLHNVNESASTFTDFKKFQAEFDKVASANKSKGTFSISGQKKGVKNRIVIGPDATVRGGIVDQKTGRLKVVVALWDPETQTGKVDINGV